jgi:hypothetical protein
MIDNPDEQEGTGDSWWQQYYKVIKAGCAPCYRRVVLFSQNKLTTNNQPTILFSQNKSTPATSHQPSEQAGDA